ncbi:hypothetical protein KFK09_009400 [Dendrobium nobile]|uniref:Uncharacterized protein n=1 Tax=Dendrobium nobile TaxID=94219 RepID=A0A8T3BLB0_DENNO|nr:hypothetical protein KFK09_009400 [Dendrobium nobile]
MLKQLQYMYLPEMDDNIKMTIFKKIQNSKRIDMESAYKEIVISYISNEEVSGISYVSKTLFSSASEERHCLCKICMPEFYMIHLSLNLTHIKRFQKWTIQKLMEYGLLNKLIISRHDKLSDQIECLEHSELKRIIWYIFEDYRIYSIIIIINSIEPAYEEFMDGAKHIIEIHKTPKSVKAEQYDDTPHSSVNPELSNQSLKYYRALQIAQYGRGFPKPIFYMQTAYQDKDMIISLHSKLIKGSLFKFRYYVKDINLIEHVKTFSSHLIINKETYYQNLTPERNMPLSDSEANDRFWIDGMDDEGLANIENAMEG